MSEQQSILLLCQGGQGDITCHTPVYRGFRRAFPDDELVIIATHANLLEHDENIDRLISFSLDREVRDIYNHYIHGKKKIRFFKHFFPYDLFFDVPRHESKTLLEYLCKVYGVEYDGGPPDYTITPYEREAATEWTKQFQKPIVFLHLTGVMLMKSVDFKYITPLIEKYKEKFSFVQIGARGEPLISGAFNALGMPIRDTISCLPHAKISILIESVFAHISAALGLKNMVIFQSTDPEFFGHPCNYNIHDNKTGGSCEEWPCNRPIGSLSKFLPAYLNLSTGQPMPWMCPKPLCAELDPDLLEQTFLGAIKEIDEQEKAGPHPSLEAAREA